MRTGGEKSKFSINNWAEVDETSSSSEESKPEEESWATKASQSKKKSNKEDKAKEPPLLDFNNFGKTSGPTFNSKKEEVEHDDV